jgi:hypothetical protein
VNISSIVRLVKGKNEADFKRATAKNSPDDCCLSVVGKERTVNFQTRAPADRDMVIFIISQHRLTTLGVNHVECTYDWVAVCRIVV